jgi:perosamine synthetase
MGFNYRMTNLEAALGLAQLGRIDEFVEKKRKYREIYRKELGDIPYIKFQEEYDEARGSWWLNCIKFDRDIDIDYLIQQLKEKGVETRRVFMPLGEMPYLKKYSKPAPNAYRIYKTGICLPSSTLNDEDAIMYAISALRKALNE